MSRTYHHDKYRIRGDRRRKPDARRLARALMAWVEAKREADAMAENQATRPPKGPRTPKRRQP